MEVSLPSFGNFLELLETLEEEGVILKTNNVRTVAFSSNGDIFMFLLGVFKRFEGRYRIQKSNLPIPFVN